jgi:hypothetical protein
MKTLFALILCLVAMSTMAVYQPNQWDTNVASALPSVAAVNAAIAGSASYYWTNLSTAVSSTTLAGTTNVGNATWTLANGALNFVGASSLFTNYLVFTNEINMSHQWTMKGVLYVSSASQVGQGVGFGTVNVANYYGGTSASSNLLFLYIVGSSFPGGVQGYMASSAFNAGGNTLIEIGGSPTNNVSLPGQNQANTFTLQRRGNTYTFVVSNGITGTQLRYGYTYTTDSLTNGYETAGASSPAIWISGPVTGSISNLVYTDDGYWPSFALLAGDSVFSGFGFPDFDSSFAVKLAKLDTAVNIDAAIGARIADLSIAAASINRWHPQILTVQVGGNDLNAGASLAAVESAFPAMVNTFSNYSQLYVCTPTPWNVFNMVPYQWWILTNYPGNSIDLFGPLSSPNFSGNETYLIKTNYFFDGIHPNSIGNSVEEHVLQNRWKQIATQ